MIGHISADESYPAITLCGEVKEKKSEEPIEYYCKPCVDRLLEVWNRGVDDADS